MGSLLKWEMKQTLSSKHFWILGAALVALPALMLLMAISFGADYTGYEAFLNGLNEYNAFVMFLIGVFAGIHVTGAFEGRKIQSAVMAGNSRFSILMAKFMSFSIVVTLYSIVAILVSTSIAFGAYGVTGLDGSFGRVIILRTLVFIFVEIAYSATTFLASMLVRHLGGAIGLNLGLMLMTNLAAQIFLNFEWSEKFVRLTPAGQAMLIVGDLSNKNIVMALVASVIAIAAVIALSFLKFRREELK